MADGGKATPSLSTIGRDDLIFLIAGLLAFIFSFIDFAHLSISNVGTISGSSITAWHGTGALAAVLVLLSIGLSAYNVFSPGALDDMPLAPRVIAEGLAALGLLFFLIRWITLPGGTLFGQHYGYVLAWGGYVMLVLIIVQLVFGFLAIRSAGDSFSWQPATRTTTPPLPDGQPPTSAGAWAGPASPPPAPPEAAPPAPEGAAPPASPPAPPPPPAAPEPPPEDAPPS
jgi:hypothetical protein